MSRLRILLDNGHGKNTPGKCSLRWADGAQLYEYEFNRDIVRRIADKLASKGITFDLITPELTDIPLHQRANRVNHICNVNGVKNCLLISIHSNASENHNATGWEVWTTPGKTLSDSYAELFYKKAQAAFPGWKMRSDTTDGDHDKEARFAILRKSLCPAILTENFFMDFEKDCRFIMSEEGRNQIAQMHFDAILDCIDFYEKLSK